MLSASMKPCRAEILIRTRQASAGVVYRSAEASNVTRAHGSPTATEVQEGSRNLGPFLTSIAYVTGVRAPAFASLVLLFAAASTVSAAAQTGPARQRGRGAASSSPPVALSPVDPAVDGWRPQVAVDGRGDAFAVWQEGRVNGEFTRAAVKPAGGSWGAARTLARGGYVSLAVDARGDAVVAGLTLAAREGVFAVYRPAGGDWGRAVLLSHSVAAADAEQTAAIDGQGGAFVAWAQAGRIEVSIRRRGRWATQTVGAGADPALAVNGPGDALLVWHTPSDHDGRFLASWKRSGGSWQPPRPIPVPAGPLVRPEQAQVALDERGDADVFWTNWDADVFASSAPPGGSFGEPENLQIGYDGFQAFPAVTPSGAAALAAVANRGNGPLELRIRGSATAAWRTPIVLGQAVLQPALALDRSGRLLVAWVESDTASGGYGQLLLKLATGTSAGHISTSQTLATIGGDCFAHRCDHGGDPAVAIGPQGHAIVAWVAKADAYQGAGVVMAQSLDLPEP
jgi:hypothetical protein